MTCDHGGGRFLNDRLPSPFQGVVPSLITTDVTAFRVISTVLGSGHQTIAAIKRLRNGTAAWHLHSS